MIISGTRLKVLDNSPIKEITCIKVMKKGKYPVGTEGDLIIGSIKSLKKVKESTLQSQKHLQGKSKRKQWKKGDLVKALILATNRWNDRGKGTGAKGRYSTGIEKKFPHTLGVIILNPSGKDPEGTRILHPLPINLKGKKYQQIYTLGKTIV